MSIRTVSISKNRKNSNLPKYTGQEDHLQMDSTELKGLEIICQMLLLAEVHLATSINQVLERLALLA